MAKALSIAPRPIPFLLVRVGGKSRHALWRIAHAHGVRFSHKARTLLHTVEVLPEEEVVRLYFVNISTALGLKQATLLRRVYRRALEQGYSLCPQETALQLVGQWQVLAGSVGVQHVVVASNPIYHRKTKEPMLFTASSAGALREVGTMSGSIDDAIVQPGTVMVFVLRPTTPLAGR